MKIQIDIYHHFPSSDGDIQLILKGINKIMATITDLQAEVSKVQTVEASAITLLQGLSQQLKDALASQDPAAIQAVIDNLDVNANTLAQAVTDNTPAA